MEININPQNTDLIIKILFSLGLGLIIGLEREHRAKNQKAFAGIRAIPLITVLGTVSAYIFDTYWDKIFYFTFGILTIYTTLKFYLDYKKDTGITTEITLITAHIIGILVYFEQYYLSIIITVITAVLLALKSVLESFAKRLSQEDIIAILKFVIITIVIYPLLPDKDIGWFNAFNLKDIWKMVIVVSSLDFIGYILLRWKGSKSLWLNGVIGGLISSTAVSYELAKKTKEYPALNDTATIGITAAWIIMNFRVIFLSGIISVSLAKHLFIPLILSSIVFLLFILYKQIKKSKLYKKDDGSLNIKNPFEISSALQFGAIYAFIIFAIKALDFYLGDRGIYLAGLISGVIDVDAITLSISKVFSNGEIDEALAVKGILLAVVSNSFFKYFYVAFFGTKRLARDILVLLITITLISVIYTNI